LISVFLHLFLSVILSHAWHASGMSTNVRFHPAIRKFLESLEEQTASATLECIGLLEQEGYRLSMPFAKPIGRGLFELRIINTHSIRIIYSFLNGDVVLLVGMKKQRPALSRKDVRLAFSRLRAFATI
jgi:hypothetical protein